MKVITDISEYAADNATSIALGTFDGVHMGHIEVIKAAVADDGTTPAVFTFGSSPQGIISGKMIKSLAVAATKQRIISQLGIELFISPSFLEVKSMPAEEFVYMLVTKFKAKRLCCGFNFRFGKDGEGNANMLKTLAKKYDIDVIIIPPVMCDGLPVSSTRIRELIADGEMEQAQKLLGHPFAFEFPVIEGDHRGRSFGTPTINQQWPQNFVLPKFGVYAARALINGKSYKAVGNVGIRPTVGSEYVRCETYIMDYSGDLYGETVYVELIKFIRDEQRFDGLEELRNAILHDIESVKALEY